MQSIDFLLSIYKEDLYISHICLYNQNMKRSRNVYLYQESSASEIVCSIKTRRTELDEQVEKINNIIQKHYEGVVMDQCIKKGMKQGRM